VCKDIRPRHTRMRAEAQRSLRWLVIGASVLCALAGSGPASRQHVRPAWLRHVASKGNLATKLLRRVRSGRSQSRSAVSAVISAPPPPPTVQQPPAPPAIKKKYGGGKNRSDGVYLLSQMSTLQVTQQWRGHDGETSVEFQQMLPKIMIWSTGIEYPYPKQWSHTEYPPKFVLGRYKNNEIDSIMLCRGTSPEYAPHALTFVVDFVAVDPEKGVNVALPLLEKIRTMGIQFKVPIDYNAVKDVYAGEIEALRNSLGDDPSFNYWVMQNSGKLY